MSSKRLKNKRVSDSKKISAAVVNDHIDTIKSKTEDTRQKVNDGFANFVSRLGVGNVDNQLSQGHYQPNLLTRNRMELEWAYRGSWIVGAMIDTVAEDMTKAGVTITSNEAAENVEDFQAGLSRLQIWNSLQDTIKWARLYGGACAVMMIDGQDLASPLRIESVGKGQFSGLTTYDRWQLYPDLTEVISNGPDMGLPAYYYIITSNSLLSAELKNNQNSSTMLGTGIKVHHSRVVRMIGVKLPFFQAITEMMWGMSELERIHDRLVSFDTATMSAANLINHAHLRTVRVKDLREIMSSGGKAEEGLIKMFEYMRLLQSNEGITLLDSEDEFSTTAYSFAGLSDMLLQFGQQLSGASGIPLVRLFGQSPAGLNSTGESDIRNYYDNINAQQESNLRPGVDKILRVAYQSLFGVPAPKDMQFKFTSLWQLTDEQKANIAKTKSETVAGAFEAGLISKHVAVKELRQSSAETGVFTNISDEDIDESENELDDVPLPGDLPVQAVDSGKVIDSITKLFNKVMGGK